MMSDMVKDYSTLNEGGITHSYTRKSKDGSRAVWIRPLSSPGEWYIDWADSKHNVEGNTSKDKNKCFVSLMTAMTHANAFIVGALSQPKEFERTYSL